MTGEAVVKRDGVDEGSTTTYKPKTTMEDNQGVEIEEPENETGLTASLHRK